MSELGFEQVYDLDGGARVVDFSADYRLDDPEVFYDAKGDPERFRAMEAEGWEE